MDFTDYIENRITVMSLGLESSGRRWIDDVLDQHPDLYIHGDSVPTGRSGTIEFPEIFDADVLMIVTRDQNCQRASVRRLYDRQNFPEIACKSTIRAITQAWSKPIVWVSYESCVSWGSMYFDWIYEQLTGKRNSRVWDIETKDGNEKYFNQ